MKRILIFLASLSVLAPLHSFASESGATETVSVSTTSAATTVLLDPGSEYTLQCSVNARYRTCLATVTCTAVASDMMVPAEPAATTVIMDSGHTQMAFKTDSGSGNCRPYRNTPRNTPVYR